MLIRNPTIPEIVNRFGGHAATALGIELDEDAQLGRWLIAVCLMGGRVDEARWKRAFYQLDRAGLSDPIAIATRNSRGHSDENAIGSGALSAGGIHAELEAALLDLRDAERTAWKLIRVSTSLVENYGGSLDNLVRQTDSLEELGGRLSALAPGFGTASVMRFLRPLRDRWVEASELPLHASAHSAAVHLGLLADGEDLDGAEAALRNTVEKSPAPPPFRDVEAALERLGAWCRRNRIKTCPLADACPARSQRRGPD